MGFLDDLRLAQRIGSGDEQAFVTLIRRYERSLAALIRDRIGAVDAVEDVLQETLVHAWSGLRDKSPRHVRAWLYQVARNRCADYLRSAQRREQFVDPEELATMLNRFGVPAVRQRRAAKDVVDAFDHVPEKERAALRSFYLDGLSIAEIAARHRCPPGTIKRRLSHGRDMVRTELGVTTNRRSTAMSAESSTGNLAFPKLRPDITIEKSTGTSFSIDFQELAWWFIVPEVGDRVRWADYEPTRDGTVWRLTEDKTAAASRRAIIHGRECVEIEIEENRHRDREGLLPLNHDPDKTARHTRFWGCLTETEVHWLAVESMKSDGTRELLTCLDEDFGWDWGMSPRQVEDRDYLTEQPDGTLAKNTDAPQVFSHGLYTVRIGDRAFECMRVFDIDEDASERAVLVMAYVTRAGRTVLFRRYNGNLWGKREKPPHSWGVEMTWEEDLPHTDRLVIDGVKYVHHYDSLTDVACGLRA
ncbi:MAG: RNA polymerase sigma factor [Gemmatimonadetes bacterium]|nr:RNA polymerase sigma factor [Gemmatimonadota bacterium]MYH18395.1 RNA polymerase sigma factor [Gemmatimonadota bacterium]MYK99552.1 RNA polymerase sigma factor [Gemmatimonadota bacterium]